MSGKNTIIVERLAGGKVVRIMPDGSRRVLKDKTDRKRLKAMTEEDIEAAALSDPDNLPLTDEELKRFKPVPNPKEIRQRLHMTQEQFAAQFQVPLGTLRDWEQGAKQPDTAARSYLRVREITTNRDTGIAVKWMGVTTRAQKAACIPPPRAPR